VNTFETADFRLFIYKYYNIINNIINNMIDPDSENLAKKSRCDKLICRKCYTRQPIHARNCRKCSSVDLRQKHKLK
jgi:ribosomal protein L40E